jgi:hypothetical protein
MNKTGRVISVWRALVAILIGLLVGSFLFSSTALADDTNTTATINIAGSSTPIVGVTNAYSVGGSVTDTASPASQQYLWVYQDSSGNSCADNAQDELAVNPTTLINGVAVAPGNFNYNFDYTPAAGSYNSNISFCAYVEDTAADATPSGVADYSVDPTVGSTSVTASGPAVSQQSNPIAGNTTTFSVQALSQSPQFLWVYLDTSGSSCSDDPFDEVGQNTPVTYENGAALTPNVAFNGTFSYTPPINFANYTATLCLYVSDSATDPSPFSSESYTISPQSPSIDEAIKLNASPHALQPTYVKVTGTTPAPIYFWMFIDQSGSGCQSTVQDEISNNNVNPVISNKLLAPGAFTENYTYTPSLANVGKSINVCTYYSPNKDLDPAQTGSRLVTPRDRLLLPKNFIKSLGKLSGKYKINPSKKSTLLTLSRPKSSKESKGHPLTFSYRWETKMPGSSSFKTVSKSRTLKLNKKLKGDTIKLVVTASSHDYRSLSKTFYLGKLK